MQKLKIGVELIDKTAEEIKEYLKKNYILQHTIQLEYTVIYDKAYEPQPYRLIHSGGDNNEIQDGTLQTNPWKVLKTPKTLISFKTLL